MAKHGKEWGKKKNDRLYVISEQRNIYYRYLETAVNELPEGLDIVGEIEGSIFKIGPTGVRRPSANQEEY